MARLRPALLVPAVALLPGCVFYVNGRTGRYHGEYAPWLPHLTFFGFLIFIADVWACFHVWNSRKRGFIAKLLWSLLIFGFPVFGFILFFLFGHEG